MRVTTIIGNWKLNKTPTEAGQLASEIRSRLAESPGSDVVVCPPSISLETVSRVLKDSGIDVGAQNIHSESEGAFTGEISAEMVREFASHAIVGHSERRTLFGETDDFIGRKVATATGAGLRPILCVGEPDEIRSAGQVESYVTAQLLSGLSQLSDVSGVLVAYEPVWAIGTGQAATPDVAQQMSAALRSALRDQFGTVADQVPLLYGGSVNAGNIADFVGQADIDGALVGGASLEAESFAGIVIEASQLKS